MSASGLLFLSDTPYIAGDTVELSVVISGVIDIVKGCAKVVRVTESGNKTFDVAVKLIPEKSKSRSAKAHR